MNFFKLYVGDYQRDTAHLSITEHGAYLLMLQHYYATEKPLPTGKALHRMLRAQDKTERDAIDSVAGQFWTRTEVGLVNERADQELGKASTNRDTNRATALAREAARRAAREDHEASTNRGTKPPPRARDQTPDTRHHSVSETPRERRGSRLPPDWTPEPDAMAFAVGLLNGRCETELAKFRDYWAALPGQKGVKTDWPATWRNWVRRAAESLPAARTADVFEGAR